MHLPEFFGMAANGSLESSKHKTDLYYGPNNEIVELAWENGQVLFQGQSSRGSRKNSLSSNGSSVVGTSKTGGKFGFHNDFQPETVDEEDMVPWLNYPMDDLLPEISGVTGTEITPHQNSFVSVNKSNGKSFDSGNHPHRISFQQGQTSSKDSFRDQDSVGNVKSQNTFGFLNFSHFARPGTLGRGNVVGESGDKGKESLMESWNLAPPGQPNLILQEDGGKCHRNPGKAFGGRASKPIPDIDKTVEQIVAASSVCSVSSAERASNNSMPKLRRKRHESDESEDGPSDEVDEESIGVRKGAHTEGGCMGSKRSRAAEVHNLSERRRRDRINEKMRALQELIPNCNKVDKASMLDEAIEYLKTLQLQVQIMSMGAGLYMPQMMFPSGILPPFHAAHFPSMGMGFGMGMMDMNGTGPPRPRPQPQQQQQNPFMQGATNFSFAAPRPSSISPANGFQMFGHHSQIVPPVASTQLMVPLDVSNNGGSELSALAHKKDPAEDVG